MVVQWAMAQRLSSGRRFVREQLAGSKQCLDESTGLFLQVTLWLSRISEIPRRGR